MHEIAEIPQFLLLRQAPMDIILDPQYGGLPPSLDVIFFYQILKSYTTFNIVKGQGPQMFLSC